MNVRGETAHGGSAEGASGNANLSGKKTLAGRTSGERLNDIIHPRRHSFNTKEETFW